MARLTVPSDSKAALGMAVRRASPRAVTNAIGREIAFDMAVGDYRLELLDHTPGVANVSPDRLSRLFAPGADSRREPVALAGVREVPVPARDGTWWRSWASPGSAGEASEPPG